MITGVVNTNLQPLVGIPVYSTAGAQHGIEAMVDTGYNGWLTLPPDLIAMLGLPWSRRGRATLADGSTVVFDLYLGTLLWDGILLTVLIDEADGLPLVGMSLMHGYEVTVHAVVGGSVTIRSP